MNTSSQSSPTNPPAPSKTGSAIADSATTCTGANSTATDSKEVELGTLSEGLLARMQFAYRKLCTELHSQRNEAGHWTGELSVSALSTATAVSALSVAYRATSESPSKPNSASSGVTTGPTNLSRWRELIQKGAEWLSQAQNADGGFGDTDRSISNIATTLLVLAAWKISGLESKYAEQIVKAQRYVQDQGHWEGLRQRYGKDKTFVVPIMTNCALAGQVSWSEIPTLPFEAAALPQSWYRFAKMPVVSYAIPALVAIGQAQLIHNPPRNPIARKLRQSVRSRTLNVLRTMQPESGGYLEATPLTSFVLMNLASIGLVHHPVCQESIRFIVDSVTPDGSWPIDTNLATWVTSLTTRSLYPDLQLSTDMRDTGTVEDKPLARPAAEIPTDQAWTETVEWLLSCQHLERHPFTGAEPGGWGWTNLSGSVPDSDDTPAALLVLAKYFQSHCFRSHSSDSSGDSEPKAALGQRIQRAAQTGCEWLLKLQNSDGGWPTFCRGWGTLPFDRSGSDLTAHAIRALHAWRPHLAPPFAKRMQRGIDRGWRYLSKHQQPDGSWQPLWFGNQDRSHEDNPFYGTARVLLAYAETGRPTDPRAQQGIAFLKRHQNQDGSWGGGPSIRYAKLPDNPSAKSTGTLEETAVSLEALIACSGKLSFDRPIIDGLTWVCDAIDGDYHRESQPIGFYFAKLWYHEKQYPLAFSLAALRKGLELCQ